MSAGINLAGSDPFAGIFPDISSGNTEPTQTTKDAGALDWLNASSSLFSGLANATKPGGPAISSANPTITISQDSSGWITAKDGSTVTTSSGLPWYTWIAAGLVLLLILKAA